MKELMEWLDRQDEEEIGKDKFWTSLNLPGCPGFGMIEMGEV